MKYQATWKENLSVNHPSAKAFFNTPRHLSVEKDRKITSLIILIFVSVFFVIDQSRRTTSTFGAKVCFNFFFFIFTTISIPYFLLLSVGWFVSSMMYIELFEYVIPFQLGRAGNKELWNRKSLCWTWSRTWKTQTGKLTTLGKNVSTRLFVTN